ncbi:hypothetical protein VTK56DRAFT_10090 [Thermocarpiscus australiensis]
MSYQKFRSDVSTAAQKAAGGGVAGVLSVANGDADGEIVITYHHKTHSGDLSIRALAQNVGEYPDGNMFMLWTDQPDPPRALVAAIEAAQDYLLGMSVYEMVTEVARRLEKEFSGAMDGDDDSAAETGDDADDADDADDYDADYDADYPSDGDEFGLPSSVPPRSHHIFDLSVNQEVVLQRIRRDLRRVKQAGYKVGFLDAFGRTGVSGLVSISIRVQNLALSEEAMEAWDLTPTEYIVLLMRFDTAYDPLERIVDRPARHASVKFRIGKCNRYKPSHAQALAAFTKSARSSATDNADPLSEDQDCGDANFEKLFISNSLDQFLDESFISLLKLREAKGLDWEQANELFLTMASLGSEDQQLPGPPEGANSRNSPNPRHAAECHQVLVPDHLLETSSATERSLPLVAMQFAMRYLVKCTEYCLRCHRRLEKGFEALRPYVCDNPLCLFQYMAMGFGPSIEHEILTQPYVVDLLVSLCYAAIQPWNARYSAPAPGGDPKETKLPIRALPVGLRLWVPDLVSPTAEPLRAQIVPSTEQRELRLVFNGEGAEDLNRRWATAKWAAYRKPGGGNARHVRILHVYDDTKTAIVEEVSESGVSWAADPMWAQRMYETKAQPKPEEGIVDVFPYDTDFDSLGDFFKANAMRHILDTLPSILSIEEWLNSHPQDSLRSMDGISPAAASLLQWIVSSNRSCIFQVDRALPVTAQRAGGPALQPSEQPTTLAKPPSAVLKPAGKGRNREHERILGMDGWVQFRFAQGSPDKELRFNRALQEVAARKPIQSNPTIFAWHGSPLANWHSIVRTGLDYNEVKNGRAYGNGVYFSPQYSTSVGYANGYLGGLAPQCWPNSDLKISTCMSLNEIINAPDEFVSRTPHYVVSQLDWHQCRYLLVKTVGAVPDVASQKSKKGNVAGGQGFHPQARGLEVYGQSGAPLQIPLAAIPLRSAGAKAYAQPSPAKRSIRRLEDSDNEDAEDVAILFSDDEMTVVDGPPSKKPASPASTVDSTTAGEM